MKTIINSIKIFLLLTVITGLIYPAFITLFAQVVFPNKANGSLVVKNDKIIGSELIGQEFKSPEYFWGRPSAISNNPMPSGASNLSVTDCVFKSEFNKRIDTIKKYHTIRSINQIPMDFLFASGSGVDPEISPFAAYFQLDRICKYRNFNNNQKQQLYDYIAKNIIHRTFYLFGEDRINVLKLNLFLKEL